MKIYIGADHRGFELKESIKRWLSEKGHEVEDLGAHEYDKDDDYPVYAEKVGRAVVSDAGSFGIALCGSGTGMDAAINKVKGIRASIGYRTEEVKAGRHDDDMNAMVLSADYTEENDAKKLINEFLNTPFDDSVERYNRRIKQIHDIEKNGS